MRLHDENTNLLARSTEEDRQFNDSNNVQEQFRMHTNEMNPNKSMLKCVVDLFG